jgi:SAM-dependent methyltransferase
MDERFHAFERSIEDWHWWYRGRRDILDAYLSRLPLDPEASLLLDIGCGTGGNSVVLSRYGRVVGLDRAQQSFRLSPDRPYRHRVVGTAESLPFRDETFDVVSALDVLEHLDDDVGGAREVRRVLRPGGTAVIFVPALRILWGHNDDFSHHRRRYDRDSLRRTVEAAGLSIESIGYFNLVLLLPTLLARLSERVVPQVIHRIEYNAHPTWMNQVLLAIFRLELPWLRRPHLPPLPLGTSVVCLARR